jgi:hypothetical protein
MAINYMEDFDIKTLEHYNPNGATLPSADQYVGTLAVQNRKLNFSANPRDNINYQLDGFSFVSQKTYEERNLVVILESPHRFEYNASNQPLGLAMGKTGYLFFDMFENALSKSRMSIKDGHYNVILMNAVQYQTSCGLNPINREIRDQNWLDIYDRYGGELNLKKRIYAIKPRYTINCCTGGKNPSGLRARVSQSLEKFKLIKGKHFTEGNHPASWNFNGDTTYASIE